MWQPKLLGLVAAAALVRVLAVQVPLASSEPWEGQHRPTFDVLGEKDNVEWNLNEHPNPNDTDNLVFETVYSLLQRWPNTRMRNGHSAVPGIILNGTLLYHGRSDNRLPSGPEWISTDPEHAYMFCRDASHPSERGGWQLTLMTTRPLKMIYFDGSSSVGVRDGTMDTQDLLIWGRLGDVFNDEIERIEDLCKWGKNFSVDGFVRMEMDFEIMLCDFAAGVDVVSFANLDSGWTGPSPASSYELFEVINAGGWHNRFPGETRIQLDLPGMVSFYDTELAPSLVPIRADQERWDHRVLKISSSDLAAIKSRLEANLKRAEGASSGVDWKTLFQIVIDRYAGRLELTRHLLNVSATSPDDILDLAEKTQTQLRIMLTPYILSSAIQAYQSDSTELDWTIPIYKHCATAHSDAIESRFSFMTDSEKMLLRAVRGTTREICRVVTKMWAAGVYAGVDPSLKPKEVYNISGVVHLQETWADDLEHLMAWLDWNVWVKCNPGCGIEETCYLPTWPIGFPWLADAPLPFPIPIDNFTPDRGMTHLALRTAAMKKFANEVNSGFKPEPDEWIRPQPKCIRRVKPYRF